MSNKRAWFQLHLSTLIVVSFVAGGIIWPNMPCDYAHFGRRGPRLRMAGETPALQL